jgi:hypothetical protein
MNTDEQHRLSDLRVRDPFVLTDPDTQTYYLCVALRPSESHPRHGVGVYTRADHGIRNPGRFLGPRGDLGTRTAPLSRQVLSFPDVQYRQAPT